MRWGPGPRPGGTVLGPPKHPLASMEFLEDDEKNRCAPPLLWPPCGLWTLQGANLGAAHSIIPACPSPQQSAHTPSNAAEETPPCSVLTLADTGWPITNHPSTTHL